MQWVATWIENAETSTEIRTLDALTHPDGKIAMRFWRERPADGLRIGRDVPSRAIARLLSCIVVWESARDGEDFRLQLAGSGARSRFGRDITGEYASQLFSDKATFAAHFRMLSEVIAKGQPHIVGIVYCARSVEVMRIEILAIPAVASDGIGQRVLTFGFYL
jgi:hypothetical protein